MIYFTASLLSVFITVSLIPGMTNLAARLQLVDMPDHRKIHTFPVPRIGGLAIALGAVVPVIFWAQSSSFMRAYLIGAGILVLFGLLDDIKGLGYAAKFAGQFLAALAVVAQGGVRINSLGSLLPGAGLLPVWFAFIFTVIAVIGVTNAINLSDGLDGLAGGISLLGFCCIAFLAYLRGNEAIVLMSLSLGGAIFGFLRYNTHPASLFMGDTGSQLLGFSAAVFAIKITQGDTPFSPVLPLIILGFPILDTLTVMAERVREGRSPFSADKNHFHHRLIRLGLSHAEAVLMIYIIQAAMIVAALVFKYDDRVLMTSYTLFAVLIISAFAVADRKEFRFRDHPLARYMASDRLKKITTGDWIIKVSFTVSRVIVPLLLPLSCLMPAKVPGYISAIAFCFGMLIVFFWIFARKKLSSCLRVVCYLTIPPLLYLIYRGRGAWISHATFTVYNFSFVIIAVFALLTARFTRRKKGFRMTSMDFLVIFIALLVPNLPDQSIQNYHLGFLAVGIIVLLFSYELLIDELRDKLNTPAAAMLTALGLIGLRGVLG